MAPVSHPFSFAPVQPMRMSELEVCHFGPDQTVTYRRIVTLQSSRTHATQSLPLNPTLLVLTIQSHQRDLNLTHYWVVTSP